MKIKLSNKQLLSSAVTLVGLSLGSTLHAQGNEPSRGPDIGMAAGNCNIGPFPQTTKAGIYNVLCNVMPDAEKCFAFVKGHIEYDGTVSQVSEHDAEKAKYCLDVLKQELGLN